MTAKSCKCVFCKNDITEEQQEQMVKRGSLRFHHECYNQYRETDDKPEIKVRTRSCPHCKEKLSPLDEDAVDVSNHTYHISCYESIKRVEKNRNDLLDYISLKYNMEFPTGYMLKQVNEYHNKRGYSYKAMKATLMYILDVEKIPIKEGTGIGMVPYYYEKAKIYYGKLRTAKEASKNITIDNTPVMIKSKEKERNSSKRFNLNDL